MAHLDRVLLAFSDTADKAVWVQGVEGYAAAHHGLTAWQHQPPAEKQPSVSFGQKVHALKADYLQRAARLVNYKRGCMSA